MNWLAAWWRQPDHFDWLTGYLQAHGLSANTRRVLAGVSASLALWPVNVLWGQTPFYPRVALTVSTLAGLVGLGMALVWLSRWPTRRQSIVFAMTGSASVAAGCLWQTEPIVALMACSALAVPGGYVAFFHTGRYMALNFCLAGAVGAFEVVRLVFAGDATLAFTGYFLVLELNVIVPFAIQIVVRALGVDLLRADRDPLTGLLNRRACDRAVIGRILAGSDHMYLAVAMVDLDRFKAVNDSQGHAAGDKALVAAARALTAACLDTSVIGRVGGEEFLIADVVSAEPPHGWGHRLCRAVAAIPAPVTASVGTATLPLRSVGCDDAERAFRQLVAEADTAMYEAKRCGGNRARHHCAAVAPTS
ncbi:diguanylate cyclase [Mycobacterium paraense]|uniref:Diguanylate cyclase n=1 Tax=Mycobacterium paraense TaxID=767916 RepID=A0ABX3VS60_9MYCO|nr:GGDEF domain-containing protein [Mycobacterium paraense]ORW33176.1 diguanylate cyclase [Mycobacterium paraense]ORW38490.1 diguanylate cyclase [Mycobacterium paraense]